MSTDILGRGPLVRSIFEAFTHSGVNVIGGKVLPFKYMYSQPETMELNTRMRSASKEGFDIEL